VGYLRKRASRVSQLASHGIQKWFLFDGFFLRRHMMPPVVALQDPAFKKEVPALPGLPYRVITKLRSAALTVAILIVFLSVILSLATLLRLVLSGLTTLLGLSRLSALLTVLSRLTRLLTLSILIALLALLFYIVCHKSSS
jgi:hypothetical protein